MLAAIILAAGDSTRMGKPKALLPDPDGRPFIARVVRTFADAHVRDVASTALRRRRLVSQRRALASIETFGIICGVVPKLRQH